MTTGQRNGDGTVRLLEIEPDLRAYLTPDELSLASGVAIVTRSFPRGELDVDHVLKDSGAFAAVILEGLLVHRLAVGDQPALRLLCAGDMVARSGTTRTSLLSHSSHSTADRLRLAMFDDRVLVTARRFPRLFAGLQVRMAEQHQRLAAQLVICQLPRVEERLMAMMWLLAESCGRVTASGTVLPLSLTHDSLGELIGARRPTVTLALKELADQGALFRQDGEWLLTAPPPQRSQSSNGPTGSQPAISLTAPTRWGMDGVQPDPRPNPAFQQLTPIIAALHESHLRNAGEVTSRLERARRTRERTRSLLERTRSLREQIASQRVSRQAPAADR